MKLSAAGKLFLDEARQILQHVDEAKLRAERVASGKAGTLRVGFVESLSWHAGRAGFVSAIRSQAARRGVGSCVPCCLPEQVEAVRSGKLDAGFVFSLMGPERAFAHLLVAQVQDVMLAAPRGHAVTRIKRVRLRDLRDVPLSGFIGGRALSTTTASCNYASEAVSRRRALLNTPSTMLPS